MQIWIFNKVEKPKNGVVVHAITPTGLQTEMAYMDDKWTFKDKETYVDFEPILWRPL